jgi:hypothetical protein
METLYEEGHNKRNKSNGNKKLSVPIISESTRTPLGRRRSATATLKNGSEIILEVPEDTDDIDSHMRGRTYNECYDTCDVDDIQLGGEAMLSDSTATGGLEIPSWCTPRGSLGGGPGSSYGSRCGSTTSHGSTSSAISWTALQSLRRTAAAASQFTLSSPNNCDPTSIASLSRVGSGCFTSDLYSAAMCIGMKCCQVFVYFYSRNFISHGMQSSLNIWQYFFHSQLTAMLSKMTSQRNQGHLMC